MWDNQPDFNAAAQSLTCDEGLLPELGRVCWAATELHRRVHDLIGAVRGAPSEWPVNLSLAGAVRELEAVAERHAGRDVVPEHGVPRRDVLLSWCQDVGAPAARSRDGVIDQIIHGARPDEPVRYGAEDLHEVTGRLVHATSTLPVQLFVD